MEMSSMTNLRELFSAGGPVLILLLLLSVYSLSVIFFIIHFYLSSLQ